MNFKFPPIETIHIHLPLQTPQKPSPWYENIIEANEEKSPCAGRNNYIRKFVGSEDCLYLNIFTKNLRPDKPNAVMIYIHGGGHSTGSSALFAYSPDYIMMSDVVLVTFNYRTGPLGFLSLKDKSLNVPGNGGMKDQQLAMQFVKDNIHNFGGDPNNITLFGHSSGSTCVSLHCVAESSRGLFHKAIAMSGSPVCVEGLVRDKNWAFRLAKKLGFEGECENDILSFLENVDVIAMAEAQHTLIEDDEKSIVALAFGPCIEPYESDSTFMLNAPINLLKTAWSNDIDIMIGGTADEGLCNLDTSLNYEAMIPMDIRLVIDDQKSKDLATRLKEFYVRSSSSESDGYLKVKSVVLPKCFIIEPILQLKGDQVRWLDMQRWIHSRQHYGKKGLTFLYRFAVDSPTQNHYRNRWYGSGSVGVAHADELSYLWKNGQGDVPCRDSIEFITIMRFVN